MAYLDKFSNFISSYFGKFSDTFCGNLSLFVLSTIKSGSANTAEISSEACVINNKSFNTNSMRLYRFLQNEEFFVSDMLWRCYIKFAFFFLEERKIINKKEKVYINIDFTSKNDNFLILSASIKYSDKNFPIYFSIRRYPKRKNRMSQKKMERAFIKELRHLLSKQYQYVIVADRGFGNERFISLCEEFGFNYLIRVAPKITIEEGGKRYLLQDVKENADMHIKIRNWDKENGGKKIRVIVSKKEDKIWYLLTDLKDKSHCFIGERYGYRFKIEKCFQDQKSNGFDIESSKIDNYARFKRLLFIVYISQSLTLILGEFIDSEKHPIKKTYGKNYF